MYEKDVNVGFEKDIFSMQLVSPKSISYPSGYGQVMTLADLYPLITNYSEACILFGYLGRDSVSD